MGTLYNELQKWLQSPIKKSKPKEWQKQFQLIPVVKEVEVDRPAVRTGQSAKSTTPAAVPFVRNWDPIGGRPISPKLEESAVHGIAPYITGQYALDVATMAKIEVQSLAYPTGKSPSLLPWALRFSPEQAYIDLGRLSPWDQWKILWTRVGAHYFQEINQ